MADPRSRAAKLRAVIAPGSGASDGERANARAMLERIESREAAKAPARPSVRPNMTTFNGYDLGRNQSATVNLNVNLNGDDILRAAEAAQRWDDLMRDADLRNLGRTRRSTAEQPYGPPGGFPGWQPGTSNGPTQPKRPVSPRPIRKQRNGSVVGEIRFDDDPYDLG